MGYIQQAKPHMQSLLGLVEAMHAHPLPTQRERERGTNTQTDTQTGYAGLVHTPTPGRM